MYHDLCGLLPVYNMFVAVLMSLVELLCLHIDNTIQYNSRLVYAKIQDKKSSSSVLQSQ